MGDTIKKAIIDALKESIIKFLTWIGTGIIAGSYWLCLFVCIGALFLYISGFKKAGKYVGISFMLYFILQCIKVVLM